MAIMGRKKRAVAAGWEAINKQRDAEAKKSQKQNEEKVKPEDHEERMKLLKELGLVK